MIPIWQRDILRPCEALSKAGAGGQALSLLSYRPSFPSFSTPPPCSQTVPLASPPVMNSFPLSAVVPWPAFVSAAPPPTRGLMAYITPRHHLIFIVCSDSILHRAPPFLLSFVLFFSLSTGHGAQGLDHMKTSALPPGQILTLIFVICFVFCGVLFSLVVAL